jgi:hypothetical protein
MCSPGFVEAGLALPDKTGRGKRRPYETPVFLLLTPLRTIDLARKILYSQAKSQTIQQGKARATF